jgi:hypothetical protein
MRSFGIQAVNPYPQHASGGGGGSSVLYWLAVAAGLVTIGFLLGVPRGYEAGMEDALSYDGPEDEEDEDEEGGEEEEVH